MKNFFKERLTSIKVGIASSLFFVWAAGSCPCCGQPMATCATGLTFAGIAGVLTSGVYHRAADWLRFLKRKLHRRGTEEPSQ